MGVKVLANELVLNFSHLTTIECGESANTYYAQRTFLRELLDIFYLSTCHDYIYIIKKVKWPMGQRLKGVYESQISY